MNKKMLALVLCGLMLLVVISVVLIDKMPELTATNGVFDPEEVYVEVETDKAMYSEGEEVEINVFLVNKGSRAVKFTYDSAGGCKKFHHVQIFPENTSNGSIWPGPKLCPEVYTPKDVTFKANSRTKLGKVIWDQTQWNERDGPTVGPGLYRIVASVGHDVPDDTIPVQIIA